MTLLQAITPSGALSADYTLVIMVSVVGFLIITIASIVASRFVGVLKDIKSEFKLVHAEFKVVHGRIDDNEEEMNKSKLDTALLKQSVTNLNEKVDPERTAEIIYAKIMAIKG